MNKRINFEDDFFIITMRIRMVGDIITLDADPELFLEKTMDDIYFIDRTLRILCGYLEQSRHLFDRDELLEQIAGAERQFCQVLDKFAGHEGNLSVREIPAVLDKLRAFRSASVERRKTIEALLPSGDSSDSSPVVSSEELTELLKAL